MKRYLTVASERKQYVNAKSPYDAAKEAANTFKIFFTESPGMLEVIDEEHCYMFMILKDGRVINYDSEI